MIQEDCVTFEQAKSLKEKGFPQDIEVKYCYGEDGELYLSSYYYFARPSLSLVQKWLREEKNIDLDINAYFNGTDNYWIAIAKNKQWICSIDNLNSYEEALSEGINKALELI